jgi:inner membrane protein
LDTGTHLLFGVSLAGLSMLDPIVASHPEVAHAVMAGTLIGSHAPDFDSLMRLRGKPAYVRHHRGLTHSLPAPAIWSVLLGLPLAWMFGALDDGWSVVLWTFIAVCFHIALDLFNAYGVQCLRPFSAKWCHLDVLCLFDPYLFVLHATAVLIWLSGAFSPGLMFAAVYAASVAYIGWRTAQSVRTKRKLQNEYRTNGQITLIPSMSGVTWQYVAETDDSYAIGTVKQGSIKQQAILNKTGPDAYPAAAKATLGTLGVRAFLHFAQSVHVQVKERQEGYEVTWSDVRFWHNDKMPFSAAVTLDRDFNVLQDRIGWNKKTWEPPFV